MGRRNQFQAVQCLETTLGLTGFSGLGPKAANKVLHMLDVALLLFIVALLFGEARRLQHFKLGIVAAEQFYGLVMQVSNAIHGFIKEFPVVGNEHQRATVVLDPVPEPDDSIQVQVIGGLVEQQQVRRCHQGLSQIEPNTPAAGEGP